MHTLALEFSSRLRSVAVTGSDHKVLALVSEEHSKKTGMALVDEALRAASLAAGEIGRLAVGLGPGSYTGIRSAIAIAQGWQLARQTPVIGVSSVEVLAEEAIRAGFRGEWTMIVDAQRGDVYRATYVLGESGASLTEKLRIVPAAAVLSLSNLAGPDLSRFRSGAADLFPSAATLGRLSVRVAATPAEQLEPIYLREASFVKAPPPRVY